MKKQTFIFLILGALAFNLQISAQTNFNDFWTKFKAAVKAKDKTGVAAMTKFPLSMPYGMGSVRTKAQLNARYDKIFNGEVDSVRCFAVEEPQRETASRYTVACNFRGEKGLDSDKPFVYSFELTKAGWKFVGFDNINE